MYSNIAQKIFGISTTNTYIFVAFFIFLLLLILILQIYFSKNKILPYLPFLAVIFSLILVLPFESKVNFISWGNQKDGYTNNFLWYKQILQFSIILGNIYMIFLVSTLIIAMIFGIINKMFHVSSFNLWKDFSRDFLLFLVISIFTLLLINLYRVFPIYKYDMNNNPYLAFVNDTSLYGMSQFQNEGYWPYFISNFLIFYFFTGNFKTVDNINSSYLSNHMIENSAIPIQVSLIIPIFCIAFIIGILLGLKHKNNSYKIDNFLRKKIKKTNSCLRVINFFLPMATFSFFTESLLQSQIGTWMHLVFVFLLMIISWLLIYIFSTLFVVRKYKISFFTYWRIFGIYLKKSLIKNELNEDYWFYNKLISFKIIKSQENTSFSKFKKENISILTISETIIFPIILIGYLSFMPTNGWIFTSACNNFVYWIMMWLGSFFCFIGTTNIFNVPNAAQNMQASCAFNVMCGTNTGIFAPFGLLMHKVRTQINLNLLFLPYLRHIKK